MATKQINQYTAASTIDPINDQLLIDPSGTGAYNKINRNTFLGLSSAPVGLTDNQTLTNKTLTNPTINGAILSGTLSGIYTIGGTPTFPASVVSLTATQTLINKTLTSPVINSPTITNATISADVITGFTTANSGTVYGVPVASGVISSANTVSGAALTSNSIPSGVLQNNSVSAANLATNAITLGYAQITSNFTTTSTAAVLVTGLTVTVTIPAGGRRVKITAGTPALGQSSANGCIATIWDGTVGSGTQIGQYNQIPGGANAINVGATFMVIVTPSAGSKTYNVGLQTLTSGTSTFGGQSTAAGFILVEAI